MRTRRNAGRLAILLFPAVVAGCSSSGVRIADDWNPVEAIIDTFDDDSMWEEHEKERHRREMTEQVRQDWLDIHPDGDFGEQ